MEEGGRRDGGSGDRVKEGNREERRGESVTLWRESYNRRDKLLDYCIHWSFQS